MAGVLETECLPDLETVLATCFRVGIGLQIINNKPGAHKPTYADSFIDRAHSTELTYFRISLSTVRNMGLVSRPV